MTDSQDRAELRAYVEALADEEPALTPAEALLLVSICSRYPRGGGSP
jgi:hypothetical protein